MASTSLPSTRTNNDGGLELTQILNTAKEAARLAGDEIRRVIMRSRTTTDAPRAETMEKSDTTDLVTETDQKCEALVTQLLQQRYPQHAIIGEESSGADCHYTLTDEPTWTIDPIDGTTNFVHRLSLTCVLIGFLVNRQPVVGVIYDPMADEMFWAVQGQGARLQQQHQHQGADQPQRLHVSGTTTLLQAVVAMDAGYGRGEAAVDNYLSMQRAILLQRVRHVRVLGCCGLTMAYVAAGRLDAALEQGSWTQNTGPKIWDFAPGKLLVQEAGGLTRDLTRPETKQQPLDLMQRSVFAAATPELADQLMDTVHAA